MIPATFEQQSMLIVFVGLAGIIAAVSSISNVIKNYALIKASKNPRTHAANGGGDCKNLRDKDRAGGGSGASGSPPVEKITNRLRKLSARCSACCVNSRTRLSKNWTASKTGNSALSGKLENWKERTGHEP